jgi:hypothetical protein
VWQSYKLIHKILEVVFEKSVGWLKSLWRLISAWPRISILGTLAVGILSLAVLVTPEFLMLGVLWFFATVITVATYGDD